MVKKIDYCDIRNVPIVEIVVSSLNPRKFYDDDLLKELQSSVSEIGILQPVILEQKDNGSYELFVGTRRFLVAKLSGEKNIPAVIMKDVGGKQKIIFSLSENKSRQDLTPFEEAVSYVDLINQFGMSLKDISKSTGMKEDYIRRRIQILSLPTEIQEMVSMGTLNTSHVSALASIKDRDEQIIFAKGAIGESLSGEELTALVRKEYGEKQEESRTVKKPREVSGKKICIKIDTFVAWLKNITPLLSEGLSLEEKSAFRESLRYLSIQLEKAHNQLGTTKESEVSK